MSEKPEADHSKLYKNMGKVDLGDSRRRRNENSVELRRQRRNDELMKRRNITFDDEPANAGSDFDHPEILPVAIESKSMTIEESVQILMNDPTIEDLRRAFCGIRRILSSVQNPPIDEVIKAGLLEALVKALQVEDERIQFEAAWALTNIVSGTSVQTAAAVEAGVTTHLIRLCTTSTPKVVEQVVWAIANIIGDSPEFRDIMIGEGVVSALSSLANNAEHLGKSFVQIVAWAVSNVVRHKRPQVPMAVLHELAPVITKLLAYPDTATQQDTCWALSFMTDGADENMEAMLEHGVLPIVVKFLKDGKPELIPPSLRVLGNYATGADSLTQIVIDTGIITEIIPHLLISSTSSNVKECCWLISNVVAGTQSQIQYVLDTGVLELVVDVLGNGDHRSQVEAAWVMANLVHGGNSQQVLQLAYTRKAVANICAALSVKNNELVVNMLETLYGILRVVNHCEPENVSKMEILVEESGGLDSLETLQHHESEMIYNLAYKIVNEFFNEGSDEEMQAFSGMGNGSDANAGGDVVKGDVMETKFNF